MGNASDGRGGHGLVVCGRGPMDHLRDYQRAQVPFGAQPLSLALGGNERRFVSPIFLFGIFYLKEVE